jgi:hypothetical protein
MGCYEIMQEINLCPTGSDTLELLIHPDTFVTTLWGQNSPTKFTQSSHNGPSMAKGSIS